MMKNALALVVLAASLGAAGAVAPLDTAAIDKGIGRAGQSMDGGVYRISLPISMCVSVT